MGFWKSSQARGKNIAQANARVEPEAFETVHKYEKRLVGFCGQDDTDLEGEESVNFCTYSYVKEKVGSENASNFEYWAFGGCHRTCSRYQRNLIRSWNFYHEESKIIESIPVQLAIDKMVALWQKAAEELESANSKTGKFSNDKTAR